MTTRPMTEPSAAAPTLLVVDDEPHVVAAIRRSLRGEGYRLLGAHSAREGLALLAAHRVAVIVSDQQMPEQGGSEFLARVAALQPDTVRIVLSGHAPMTAVRRAIADGAIHDFIAKPWDNETLRVRVRDALHHHRALAAHGIATRTGRLAAACAAAAESQRGGNCPTVKIALPDLPQPAPRHRR